MDTDKLQAVLAEKVDGEVRFDAGSLGRLCRAGPVARCAPGRPGTAILADGFSCRTQLAAGRTGREGLHLAQLLARLTAPEARPRPEP